MEFEQLNEKNIYRISAINEKDLIEFTAQFEHILEKQQPFGVVIVRDLIEQRAVTKEDSKIVLEWTTTYKSLIEKYCLGIAMVISDEHAFHHYQRIGAKMTETIYGCRGDVFNNEKAAYDWVQQQINYYGNRWVFVDGYNSQLY